MAMCLTRGVLRQWSSAGLIRHLDSISDSCVPIKAFVIGSPQCLRLLMISHHGYLSYAEGTRVLIVAYP